MKEDNAYEVELVIISPYNIYGKKVSMRKMRGRIYVYFNKKKYDQEGIKKYYVGQTTKKPEHRAGHNGNDYLQSTTKFAKAILKWGWDAFELTVLEDYIESKEELNRLESHYIEVYDSYKNGYNSTLGGDGLFNPSEDTRRKMSEAKKGKAPHNKGKKMSDEFRQKCSKAKRGCVVPSRRKKVYCKELDMIFDSVGEAGQYLHENFGLGKQIRTQISACCTGRLNSCGKLQKEGRLTPLTWEYYND